MVGLGLMVAVNSLENRIASGYDAQGRAFSLVPISIILGFAALVAPAIARVFFLMRSADDVVRPALRDPPTVQLALLSSAASDLLIAAAIVYDLADARPTTSRLSDRWRRAAGGADSPDPSEHHLVLARGDRLAPDVRRIASTEPELDDRTEAARASRGQRACLPCP